jgi:hypothetical protein
MYHVFPHVSTVWVLVMVRILVYIYRGWVDTTTQ